MTEEKTPQNDEQTPAGTAEEATAEQAAPPVVDEVTELKDRLMRSMAEAENVRRRGERQVADAASYAVASFARDMLTVSDNLRRTLDAVTDEIREAETFKVLLEGVELTERELLKAFEKNGILKIVPEGEKFDHNLHQAMFEAEVPSAVPGTIIQVIQPGYVLKERLLRPAMVGVAKGPTAETPKVDKTA